MSEISVRIYQDAQAACGLKVGDWVRVVDKVAEHAPEWGSWYGDNMDDTVGRIGKITSIPPTSIEVYFGDCQFFYPYFVLEKVDKPKYEFKPYEPVLVRDNKFDIWIPQFYFRTNKNDYNELYITIGGAAWRYCISYKGNEHLLGTTDSPKE